MNFAEKLLPTLRSVWDRRDMVLATPWDRFKARCFPNWLLTLCPVRWVEVSDTLPLLFKE